MKVLEDTINEFSIRERQKNSNLSFIEFSSGNTIIIDKKNEELRLINSNQLLQLVISVKEEGLIVDLNACHLNIKASDQLHLSAKKIDIEASEQIKLKSSGNIVQDVGKDFLTEVGGTNKMIAVVHKITANLGNVEIKANDDVRLDGERVKLNCD